MIGRGCSSPPTSRSMTVGGATGVAGGFGAMPGSRHRRWGRREPADPLHPSPRTLLQELAAKPWTPLSPQPPPLAVVACDRTLRRWNQGWCRCDQARRGPCHSETRRRRPWWLRMVEEQMQSGVGLSGIFFAAAAEANVAGLKGYEYQVDVDWLSILEQQDRSANWPSLWRL